MCLTIPVRIKKVEGTTAELFDGRKVSIVLLIGQEKGLPAETRRRRVKAGDWVLTNADLALAKISTKEAKEINNYFK
ncbi:MAG: hypothetical protein A2731_01545 [Candidatus Buchananbacteria bacterium RIFCSPHIGHO2_01_FULL_39_8]|uniref:HypC/HybG/HupF family hydrogenase formation chaperone n=1 Tax=Candidatus Buchananbacteria bacterium RIFCSPHIGHO2_01_FULL_39_8 TaxID=1797533 RepID=A0A1G1Y1F9_9BACT|nr:hypothetical protein [uncultured bacterium]OGY46138.1 MAG: hypothetical protein A2731_01545 [Candidatus Buchananbacteria bacterium RIFCSPHIGHO2_01_FULL_39_8]